MQPIITIFCAFTRRWAVDRWLDNLKAEPFHNPIMTNLVFIVDCDEPIIAKKLKEFATNNNYRSIRVQINTDWAPNEVRIAVRRQRIAAVKNQSKALIAQTDGEYIIGLEDDTVFANTSFERLIKPLQTDSKIGYVEGVQCGRWGVKMIGAWQADNIYNPSRIETILPSENLIDYEVITAGGFYGYATMRQLYLNHEYYSLPEQPWGPDVNFGLELSKKYRCLIDWSTIYGHNDYNVLLYPDKDLSKVAFKYNEVNGKWDREDIQK